MVPADVACFGRELVRRLAEALDGGLVGAYFVGSIALGGYVADESDVDIVAVSEHRVPAEAKLLVANAVLDRTTGCPARGLEFTLYRQKVAGAPPRGADFEVNANGGTRMPRSVHLGPGAEPGFWYVLDRAIAHRAGIAIVGPPGCQVFADVPRDALLAAMKDSMRWHRATRGQRSTRCSTRAERGASRPRTRSGPSSRVRRGRDRDGSTPNSSTRQLHCGTGNLPSSGHLRSTNSSSTSRASFRTPLRGTDDGSPLWRPRGEFRLKGTGSTTWARRHRRSHSQPAPERLRPHCSISRVACLVI